MNIKIIIVAFLILINTGFKTKPAVRLLPISWLTIQGSSNLNDFSFEFSFEDYPQNIELSVSKHDTGWVIHPFSLDLPIQKFKCPNFLIKQDFRETLKHRIQPEIKIYVDSLDIMNNHPIKSRHMKALVEIGGLKRHEEIKYDLVPGVGSEINMQGTIRVNMADYQLDYDKNFMGLIKINQYVNIAFFFKFGLES